jgi:hypothetical protein
VATRWQNTSLVVCDKSGATCADPYTAAVLQLNPHDKLIIELENKLQGSLAAMDHCMVMSTKTPNEYASDNSLLNLHTHGLLVSPSARQTDGQTTFGDNIFSCTSSQMKNGSVVGNTMHYEITLKDTAAGQAHPSGIDWIHPHVHGIAKAQVSSGMASMIIVGDINRQLCAQPEHDQAAQPAKCTTSIAMSAVKHLMLPSWSYRLRKPTESISTPTTPTKTLTSAAATNFHPAILANAQPTRRRCRTARSNRADGSSP